MTSRISWRQCRAEFLSGGVVENHDHLKTLTLSQHQQCRGKKTILEQENPIMYMRRGASFRVVTSVGLLFVGGSVSSTAAPASAAHSRSHSRSSRSEALYLKREEGSLLEERSAARSSDRSGRRVAARLHSAHSSHEARDRQEAWHDGGRTTSTSLHQHHAAGRARHEARPHRREEEGPSPRSREAEGSEALMDEFRSTHGLRDGHVLLTSGDAGREYEVDAGGPTTSKDQTHQHPGYLTEGVLSGDHERREAPGSGDDSPVVLSEEGRRETARYDLDTEKKPDAERQAEAVADARAAAREAEEERRKDAPAKKRSSGRRDAAEDSSDDRRSAGSTSSWSAGERRRKDSDEASPRRRERERGERGEDRRDAGEDSFERRERRDLIDGEENAALPQDSRASADKEIEHAGRGQASGRFDYGAAYVAEQQHDGGGRRVEARHDDAAGERGRLAEDRETQHSDESEKHTRKTAALRSLLETELSEYLHHEGRREARRHRRKPTPSSPPSGVPGGHGREDSSGQDHHDDLHDRSVEGRGRAPPDGSSKEEEPRAAHGHSTSGSSSDPPSLVYEGRQHNHERTHERTAARSRRDDWFGSLKKKIFGSSQDDDDEHSDSSPDSPAGSGTSTAGGGGEQEEEAPPEENEHSDSSPPEAESHAKPAAPERDKVTIDPETGDRLYPDEDKRAAPKKDQKNQKKGHHVLAHHAKTSSEENSRDNEENKDDSDGLPDSSVFYDPADSDSLLHRQSRRGGAAPKRDEGGAAPKRDEELRGPFSEAGQVRPSVHSKIALATSSSLADSGVRPPRAVEDRPDRGVGPVEQDDSDGASARPATTHGGAAAARSYLETGVYAHPRLTKKDQEQLQSLLNECESRCPNVVARVLGPKLGPSSSSSSSAKDSQAGAKKDSPTGGSSTGGSADTTIPTSLIDEDGDKMDEFSRQHSTIAPPEGEVEDVVTSVFRSATSAGGDGSADAQGPLPAITLDDSSDTPSGTIQRAV